MKERILSHLDRHVGAYGWAGLAGYVIAFDMLAPETLSKQVDKALEHPIGKYAAMISVAVVGLHLLNAFDNYDVPDPLVKVAKALRI